MPAVNTAHWVERSAQVAASPGHYELSHSQRAAVTLERQACWEPSNPETTASRGRGPGNMFRQRKLPTETTQPDPGLCSLEKNLSKNETTVSKCDPPHQTVLTALGSSSLSPCLSKASLNPVAVSGQGEVSEPHQHHHLEHFL